MSAQGKAEMTMRYSRSKTARLVVLLAAVSIAASACGGDGDDLDPGGGDTGSETGSEAGGLDGATIIVGSKEFNEQLLLGQNAIQALEAAGAEVEDQTGLQGTENVRAALDSGDIDLYWEYTGTGWTVHLGNEAADAPGDTAELAAAVKEGDAENGVVWLDPAEANNAYAIAASSARAEELGVSTLSDYAELVNENPEDGSLCAAAEFLARDDGWVGVEETYGFDLPDANISEVELNIVYARLPGADPCSFGEVFATDGRIVGNDLVIIEDDQGVFVKYNIAMTVRQEAYDQYGEALEEVFNPITELLTNEKMIELNAQIDVDGEDPADVAAAFLEENGMAG